VLKEHTELANTGVFCLNAPAEGLPGLQRKTLLVLGAPRGGTSAIAGALSAMGIYMGRGASAPVFESLALANAIEDDDRELARKIIEGFNAEYETWAFKRPGFTRVVSEFHGFFRNPVYLVILRDPVATASRSFISGRLKLNYLKKLRRVTAVYESIVNFVETSGAPTVFISYEKLLQDPRSTLGIIVDELGLNISTERLSQAVKFIEPSPEHYLEVSRADRVDGAWQTFNSTSIAGWAKYVNKTMTIPPKVTLFQGSQTLATVSADRPCTVDNAGSQVTENCGFSFDLIGLEISDWESLRVRVVGEIRDFDAPTFDDQAETRESHWWQRLIRGLQSDD
jgi:Sulfotransferase family